MTTIDLKKSERDIDVVVQRKIKNEIMGKRYFVAELVKKALDKYFKYDEIVVSNENSIYKLPLINEELNIVDFEINSLSVHVIPTFDKAKNANVYIPSLYKQYHFKPDMFLFVNFSKTFAKMEILGFITEPDLKMLALPKAVLVSPDNLASTIETLVPRQNKISTGTIETTKELMLAYFENDLSEEGKRFFLKNIITSKEVRKNYKLFYDLNSDFVFIAKDNNIEKFNPTEKRIELFSRSDYLMDKAISKYNGEETDADENYQTEETTDVDNYQYEEEKNLVDTDEDKILQLSLTPLNLEEDEQEELIEDIPDEQFYNQSEFTEDENSSEEEFQLLEEDTTDDNEELLLAEEDTENEDLEETLVETDEENLDTDDVVLDLNESGLTEEDLLDNSEINLDEVDALDDINIQDDEDLQIEDNTEEYLPTEEELVDITETGEDVNDVLDESFPDVVELEEDETIVENQQEVAQDEPAEEDLFAFLSEISDEEIENNTNANASVQTAPEQNYSAPEEQTYQQQNYIPQEEQYVAPVMQDAYQNNYQEPQAQTASTPQKPKSNTKALFVVFVCVCLLGAYQYKDQIIQKLPFGNNEATSTDAILNTNTPAPIDTAKLAEKVKLPADVDNATPSNSTTPTQPKADTQTAPTKVDTNKPSDNLPALPTTTVEPPKPKHLNDAIATALTKDFSGVRISKLSWEISETLVANPEVKRYLTIAGKSIKNALAQDLLAATEPSFNDRIVVNVTYRKDGSVARVDIASSSGSKQIDDIITKSVKGTLNYVKMPPMNLTNPEYNAKIVIGL